MGQPNFAAGGRTFFSPSTTRPVDVHVGMSRVLLLVVLALTGCACARASEARPAAAAKDAPVKMSPFEVSAMSVEFKRWIKFGSPNFLVYTDASEKEATQVLRELEMLHGAAQAFFGRKALSMARRTVILPTAGSDWRKLETKGSVEWKVAVGTVADEVRDLIVVKYDWQDEGISIVRAAQGYGEIRRVHFPGPFWFTRGVGKFFETAEFKKDTVVLGRHNPRIAALRASSWLPWDRFFAVEINSPEFTKEGKVQIFDAQCAIFFQYIFTHEDEAWRNRFFQWLAHVNAGHPPTEAEFKAIFGEDFKTWQRTMSRYFEGGRYQMYALKVPPAVMNFTVQRFNLPVREIRELFILTQILVQDVSASDEALDSLLADGLKTEELREFLAAACLDRKRPAAALEQLRKLIADGSTNPLVYTVAADLLTQTNAPKITLDARLGEEVTEIRAHCVKAQKLEPYLPDANITLAWAEALAPEVDQQAVVTIEQLFQNVRGQLPTDDIVAALSVALWRVGDNDTAKALAKELENEKLGSKHTREIATALLKRIEGR